MVAHQIELALSPYRALVPSEILERLGWLVEMMFMQHPSGAGLMAALSPELLVKVGISEDPAQRSFDGYALFPLQRATYDTIRAYKLKKGLFEFLPSPLAIDALAAFAGYLPYDEFMWQCTREELQIGAQCLGDASMAALVVGMVQDVRLRPTYLTEWGESGAALSVRLPLLRSTLVRARSTLLMRNQIILDVCEATQWNATVSSKRLDVQEHVLNRLCADAMGELGIAIRVLHEDSLTPLPPEAGPEPDA